MKIRIAVRSLSLLAALMVFRSSMADVSPEDSKGLEEIVVTARKSEEPLQTVPISITAFTGQDLTERSLSDLSDVGQFTPNFTFS